MRKYIIVPVLLAVVLVMMCHCTSDRKATVPANEYLIQGELANLSDSIVIGLYVDEGNIFNLVARDTLLNGKFSFRDTVSVTKKMLIMSDNKGFPGTWLEVWIAPGEYIEIKGEDKLLKTWEVVSDIPEQAEENRFTACAMAQQKELMQHLAAEYDWQRMMFIDHAGDQEFEKKGSFFSCIIPPRAPRRDLQKHPGMVKLSVVKASLGVVNRRPSSRRELKNLS